MPATPSGPAFERSPDQRIIPGGYENPSPPSIPLPGTTLVERLRAAIRKPVGRRRGPGFRKPAGWAQWKDEGNVKKSPSSRRRPSGYEFPDAEASP